ncbi:MAG: TonB family protein [Candidatus Omnitrophica bacterium]|nr:TonB family protein [Candidatus Omnitrophota bacterium]MDD5770806.1 TonB family protein [Candidatus Omnitrophota bacterium]
MNSDRLLCYTFAFSIVFHSALLMQNAQLNPLAPPLKSQTIKVRYLNKEELRPKIQLKKDEERTIRKQDPFLNLDSKVSKATAKSKVPPPYIEREKLLKGSQELPSKSPELAKPAFGNSGILSIKRKVSLPKIEMARINNPSYISYYQLVREKIRRSAYQSYIHNEVGEVYLSFVISNDGYVKDIRLIDAKTNASEYLKRIALKSVRDASPFPNFPKELDYPQLSFNIIISFEIE